MSGLRESYGDGAACASAAVDASESEYSGAVDTRGIHRADGNG